MTALVGRSAGQATQGRPRPPLHRPLRASIGVWVRPPKGTGSQILTVGVMNHPAVRLSSRDRHRQCALDQFGLHVRRHRPTDDVVALANRMARIIWAVTVKAENYRARGMTRVVEAAA